MPDPVSAPLTLWESFEAPAAAVPRLEGLGWASWSIRIRQGRSWMWSRFDGVLSLDFLKEHVAVLPGGALRVWQPTPSLGTVLVDSTSPRRQTLASWQPFPDPGLAALHEECFEVSSKVLASHGASDLLGSPLRRPASPRKDPAYWLASSSPLLARCALGLARARLVPLEAAAATLEAAGFLRLSPEAAEVAATLSGEWTRDVPSLLDTAALLV